MSDRKLPAGDACFQHWVAQGDGRRFAAVAEHFGVDRAQVTRLAKRENWVQRLQQEIEPVVAARTQEIIVGDLATMRARHAEAALALQTRALEALKSFRIVDIKDAIRALEIGVKMEKEARGDVPNRTVTHELTLDLRERLIPAAVSKPCNLTGPKPRLEVSFGDLEDGLSEADVTAVRRELEDQSDE